jgi:hypothetical protein
MINSQKKTSVIQEGYGEFQIDGAKRTIWTVYFDPKVDQIATCDLANPV